MLKTSQKAQLREGLKEQQSSDRQLVLTGESYRELADELNAKLGVSVTPRSVRHYVQAIEREHPEWTRRALRKGRPVKQGPSPAERLTMEVSEYLLKLTGFSESALHEVLHKATAGKWPQMGKVTYHKLFKETRNNRSVLKIEDPKQWTDQCCIILGHALISTQTSAEQWLLLWGVDAGTSFFSFQLINLLPEEAPAKRSKGRPRKADVPDQALWEVGRNGLPDVRLPASVLLSFLNDCQRRMCLPVSRAILPHGYPATALAGAENSHVSLAQVYEGAPALILSADALSALPDPMALKERLEQVAKQHYKKTARPYVSQVRKEFRELVEGYRIEIGKSAWPQALSKTMPDAMALDQFYSSQPAFKIEDMYRKSHLLRLNIKKNPNHPQTNQATNQQKLPLKKHEEI